MIWDDHQGRAIGELSFRNSVSVLLWLVAARSPVFACYCSWQTHAVGAKISEYTACAHHLLSLLCMCRCALCACARTASQWPWSTACWCTTLQVCVQGAASCSHVLAAHLFEGKVRHGTASEKRYCVADLFRNWRRSVRLLQGQYICIYATDPCAQQQRLCFPTRPRLLGLSA